MGFGFKQPLVGEKRCVTTQITAAKETNQMFGTKQRNLNLVFVMLTRLRCRSLINCQVQTVSTFTGLNFIVSGAHD